jgi:hypothetical protein
MRALDAHPEVEKTSLFGTAVHAVLRDLTVDPAILAAQLRAAGVTVATLTEVQPSLEDVFLDVVEKAARRAS